MKLAIHGTGRMGRAVERVCESRGHEIAGRFDSSNPISPAAIGDANVIIDFSHADAIDRVVQAACEAGKALVTGTTGWNDREDEIRKRVEKAEIGMVHAANFSPGANILFRLGVVAGELASKFGGFEAGIEERHHSQKKDAPSGTAIRLGKVFAEGFGEQPPIVSSRVGAEFGLHTLFLDSPEDLVELSHRARSRDGFATGAVLAAERIGGSTGFMSFAELMEL
ncbi:MAG: 4-hydroxy-tetrahydrodipicolinate reductase [Acidobacteria bacterium]|nr:4-hydroxy-tetrahydrodipicolinate reductase [Acidobacteriota bacterium]